MDRERGVWNGWAAQAWAETGRGCRIGGGKELTALAGGYEMVYSLVDRWVFFLAGLELF